MNPKRWQKEAFARRYRSDNFAPIVLTKPRLGNQVISWYQFEKRLKKEWIAVIQSEQNYQKKIWLMNVFSIRSDLTSET